MNAKSDCVAARALNWVGCLLLQTKKTRRRRELQRNQVAFANPRFKREAARSPGQARAPSSPFESGSKAQLRATNSRSVVVCTRNLSSVPIAVGSRRRASKMMPLMNTFDSRLESLWKTIVCGSCIVLAPRLESALASTHPSFLAGQPDRQFCSSSIVCQAESFLPSVLAGRSTTRMGQTVGMQVIPVSIHISGDVDQQRHETCLSERSPHPHLVPGPVGPFSLPTLKRLQPLFHSCRAFR